MENYDLISLRIWRLLPLLQQMAERQMKVLLSADVSLTTTNVDRIEVDSGNLLPIVVRPVVNKSSRPRIVIVVDGFPDSRILTVNNERLLAQFNIVKKLLAANYEVTVVVATPHDEAVAKMWKRASSSTEFRVYSAKALHDAYSRETGTKRARLRDIFGPVKSSNLEKDLSRQYMVQSRFVALGLAHLHRVWAFDIVEFVDYGGLAFDTLNENFLPDTVLVFIRVFGSMQIRDRAESLFLPSEERRMLYLNEQQALLTADMIICPTFSCRQYTSAVYGIFPDEISVHPLMSTLPPYLAKPDAVNDGDQVAIENASKTSVSQALRRALVYDDAFQEFFIYGDVNVNMLKSLILPTLAEFARSYGTYYRKLHFHISPCPEFYISEQSLESILKKTIPTAAQAFFSFSCAMEAETMNRLENAAGVIFLPSPSMDINVPAFSRHVADRNIPMVMPSVRTFLDAFSAEHGQFYPLPLLSSHISSDDEQVKEYPALTDVLKEMLKKRAPMTSDVRSDAVVDTTVYRHYHGDKRRKNGNIRADYLMAKRRELKERISRF